MQNIKQLSLGLLDWKNWLLAECHANLREYGSFAHASLYSLVYLHALPVAPIASTIDL